MWCLIRLFEFSKNWPCRIKRPIRFIKICIIFNHLFKCFEKETLSCFIEPKCVLRIITRVCLSSKKLHSLFWRIVWNNYGCCPFSILNINLLITVEKFSKSIINKLTYPSISISLSYIMPVTVEFLFGNKMNIILIDSFISSFCRLQIRDCVNKVFFNVVVFKEVSIGNFYFLFSFKPTIIFTKKSIHQGNGIINSGTAMQKTIIH